MRTLGTILLTAVEAALATFGALLLFFGVDEREPKAAIVGAILVSGIVLAVVVGRKKTSPERRPSLWLQGAVALLTVPLLLGLFFSMASSRSSNGRNASSTLKTLVTAEADFRANDRDNDRIQEYWVRDVAGLYLLVPEGGGDPIKLVEVSLAAADAAPSPDSARVLKEVAEPGPKAGYFFRALLHYEDDDGKLVPYDQGKGRNHTLFGFVAYPKKQVEGGRLTFIVNEEGLIWRKDTGGKPVLVWPKDPKAAGWTKLD